MAKLTIISGFLGAGKTTFANLLLDYHIRMGKKVAYIVNEFGQTGLDSALLSQKGFDTVDIFGGCICCTLRGKITEALKDVAQRFNPDQIVFEPSGVFVFDSFLTVLEDPFLKENIHIDGVVTIVDSTHTSDAMLVPGNFFANQISHADTLLLSKLAQYQGDLPRLKERLGSLNSSAKIVAVPWGDLSDADFAAFSKAESTGITAGDGQQHGHAPMQTLNITPRFFESADIEALSQQIKQGFFGELYRIKGKIVFNGEPKLLQASFSSIAIDENPPAGDVQLTFIGNGLNMARIKAYWGPIADAVL